jgi:sigma54-dependent transcription regulator
MYPDRKNHGSASRISNAASRQGCEPARICSKSSALSNSRSLSVAGGRITPVIVDEEMARLGALWRTPSATASVLEGLLEPDALEAMDLFDRLQLEAVVTAVRGCRSLSDAGRRLFASSRARKASPNDADRLRKYLARFGLTWDQVRQDAAATPH